MGLQWTLSERQSSDTDAFTICRYCSAFCECGLALNADRADEVGLALGVEALNA